MRTWMMAVICGGLAVALAAPAARAQAGDDDAKAKYEALRNQAFELMKEMGKLRGKYDQDPELAAARRAEMDARKAEMDAVKNCAAAAEARKNAEAARKQVEGAIEAALAADPEAAPVLKKHQDATRRLEELKEEIKKLTDEERQLQKDLQEHQRRVSRNRDIGKDPRAAAAEADKAYSDALKNDAAVQAARKAANEARGNYDKARQPKLAADPEYARLAEKAKALDEQMKALRDAARPKRAPKAKKDE